MNSQKIIELLLSGAYHEGNKFFHHSFRKGYRTIQSSNISFQSALRKLGNQVKLENGKYSI